MSVLAICIIGVCTFAIRASFWLVARPVWLDRWKPFLSRLPAVVLPILAVSSLVGIQAGSAHLLGGGLALLVMWRTKSVMASMGLGFAANWLLERFVF